MTKGYSSFGKTRTKIHEFFRLHSVYTYTSNDFVKYCVFIGAYFSADVPFPSLPLQFTEGLT